MVLVRRSVACSMDVAEGSFHVPTSTQATSPLTTLLAQVPFKLAPRSPTDPLDGVSASESLGSHALDLSNLS